MLLFEKEDIYTLKILLTVIAVIAQNTIITVSYCNLSKVLKALIYFNAFCEKHSRDSLRGKYGQ